MLMCRKCRFAIFGVVYWEKPKFPKVKEDSRKRWKATLSDRCKKACAPCQ
jgi:hypothetical protein